MARKKQGEADGIRLFPISKKSGYHPLLLACIPKHGLTPTHVFANLQPVTDANFYDQLRQKLHIWAASKDGQKSNWVDYILFLPDFAYLLGALLLDPGIPPKHKAKLGMVIAYIISPLDLLPEGIIGPAGYAEDLALAAYVINQLLNQVDNEMVLKHWKGDRDLLEVVRHIIGVTDEMVGSGLWKKVKAMLNTN